MMKRLVEASPRFKARMAGSFFLLTMLTAAFTELVALRRLSFAADVAAGVVELSGMVAVTLLFYPLFKPVNRNLSLLAAFFSLVGCAVGAFTLLFQLASLLVLGGAPYLGVFTEEQLRALAFMFLRL